MYTAGFELAGEVESVGSEVEGFSVGDRVMGSSLSAFAPYALLDQRHAIAVPESLGWSEAAALPVGLSTEHDALVTQGGFQAGDSVLVVGATSSIGLLAIQLAKALGAGLVLATTITASPPRVVLARLSSTHHTPCSETAIARGFSRTSLAKMRRGSEPLWTNTARNAGWFAPTTQRGASRASITPTLWGRARFDGAPGRGGDVHRSPVRARRLARPA